MTYITYITFLIKYLEGDLFSSLANTSWSLGFFSFDYGRHNGKFVAFT